MKSRSSSHTSKVDGGHILVLSFIQFPEKNKYMTRLNEHVWNVLIQSNQSGVTLLWSKKLWPFLIGCPRFLFFAHLLRWFTVAALLVLQKGEWTGRVTFQKKKMNWHLWMMCQGHSIHKKIKRFHTKGWRTEEIYELREIQKGCSVFPSQQVLMRRRSERIKTGPYIFFCQHCQ